MSNGGGGVEEGGGGGGGGERESRELKGEPLAVEPKGTEL